MPKAEVTIKFVPITLQDIEPVGKKIAEALAMLVDIGLDIAKKNDLNPEKYRTLLDELFMLVIHKTIEHWLDSMQKANFQAFSELKKIQGNRE